MNECIQKGILTNFLLKNKSEVIAMSIFEYDKDKIGIYRRGNMKKRIYACITFVFVLILCCMPVNAGSTFSLNKTSVTMYQKQSCKLKAEFKGKKKKVTWKSSNPSVAVVTKNGKITAKRKGRVVITATVGKTKKKCKIKVLAPTIKLNKKSAVIYTNKSPKTITLKVNVKGASHKVKWASTKKSVATVSGGKVKAVKPGTAIIKATANGKTVTCKITVKKANTASAVSMKNILNLYAQKKYTEAQNMAYKLPTKASDGYVSAAAKVAYRRKLEKYDVTYLKKGQGVWAFYLTDINKDGMAEILYEYSDGSESGRKVDIWTYVNGSTVFCGTVYVGNSSLHAYPDGNGVVQIYNHMGYEAINLITMNGTSIKTEEIGARDTRFRDTFDHFPYTLSDHLGVENEIFLDALY